MPIIKWRDSYSVGIKEIDKEHKNLVKIINDLFEIVKVEGNIRDSSNCIERLIEYTKEHFNDEESILEAAGFPLLDEHKVIHHNLLEKVVELKERIDSGKEDVTQELYLFLRDWLITHILDEDMKYKKFME